MMRRVTLSALLLALALPLSAQVTDGTVADFQKISDTAGNFTATLDNSDLFGSSVTALGDMDGDSVPDLAVDAFFDDDGGANRGSIYVLFMNNATPAAPTCLTVAAGDGQVGHHNASKLRAGNSI